MKKIDLNVYVDWIQDEIKLVAAILAEKGPRRFHRALALLCVLPLAVYLFVYAPAQKKLSTLAADLQTARTAAENAKTYKELKDLLAAPYAQLPLPKDRTDWLSDTVKEALRAEDIVPSRFMPPSEEEANNAVIQTIHITMSVKFSEMISFLARLEALQPAVYITSLEVAKQSSPAQIGRNEVSCSISTIIFMERY